MQRPPEAPRSCPLLRTCPTLARTGSSWEAPDGPASPFSWPVPRCASAVETQLQTRRFQRLSEQYQLDFLVSCWLAAGRSRSPVERFETVCAVVQHLVASAQTEQSPWEHYAYHCRRTRLCTSSANAWPGAGPGKLSTSMCPPVSASGSLELSMLHCMRACLCQLLERRDFRNGGTATVF